MSPTAQIHLRKAILTDLSLLLHWQQQPHVTSGVPDDDDWNWENELSRDHDWRELLIAEYDDRPIGFIQIIDPALEETHYWGNVANHLRAIDIWIGEAEYLGKGFGTKMMTLAIDRCFATPEITGILIDPMESNKRVFSFYEKLGFKYVENRILEDVDCRIYFLNRQDWKK